MSLVVMPQVLFILEHLVTILTLKGVIVLKTTLYQVFQLLLHLVPLFMPLSMRDGVKNNTTKRAAICHSFFRCLLKKIVK